MLLGPQVYQNRKQIKEDDFSSLIFLKDDNLSKIIDVTKNCNPNEKKILKILKPIKLKAHNHLEKNYQITNKKELFYNICHYYKLMGDDPFKYIPLTFHFISGKSDE